MNGEVWIGGIGLISAIGNNVAETLESLEKGRSGVADMQFLQSVHRGVFPVAEVKQSNESLAAAAQMPAMILLLTSQSPACNTHREKAGMSALGFVRMLANFGTTNTKTTTGANKPLAMSTMG